MKKTKKGFTLIELIVVIAVLAVLAAIAIPVVGNVLTKANQNVDLANEKTLESVMKTYFTLNPTLTVDATNSAAALTGAGIDTKLKVQQDNAKKFVIDKTTFVASIGDTTGATQVTGFDNIYFK